MQDRRGPNLARVLPDGRRLQFRIGVCGQAPICIACSMGDCWVWCRLLCWCCPRAGVQLVKSWGRSSVMRLYPWWCPAGRPACVAVLKDRCLLVSLQGAHPLAVHNCNGCNAHVCGLLGNVFYAAVRVLWQQCLVPDADWWDGQC